MALYLKPLLVLLRAMWSQKLHQEHPQIALSTRPLATRKHLSPKYIKYIFIFIGEKEEESEKNEVNLSALFLDI